MKIQQILCFAALALPLSANADFLSVSAGGGLWNESPSGNFQKIGDPDDVNVNDHLHWDDESQGYLFISFEHFVPLLPNVRLMHTTIDHNGSGVANFEFGGIQFDGIVTNDISIDATDLIAYYEVLDNIVSLDLGLNIKNLHVDYSISSTGSSTSDSFNVTVPMLYALVGASPWPDLIISGEISYIALDGSNISDFTAKVAYTTNFLLGFEAGYRKQRFEFDDISDTDSNLDFDGMFVGAYLKF